MRVRRSYGVSFTKHETARAANFTRKRPRLAWPVQKAGAFFNKARERCIKCSRSRLVANAEKYCTKLSRQARFGQARARGRPSKDVIRRAPSRGHFFRVGRRRRKRGPVGDPGPPGSSSSPTRGGRRRAALTTGGTACATRPGPPPQPKPGATGAAFVGAGHVTLSTSLLGVSPRKLANTSRLEAHAGLGAAWPR